MSRTPTGTRERLLDAACELIAQKGYHATTHQEICDNADANIAAINYYFGSKERLYEEVWERAHELMVQAHPTSEPHGMTAEDALIQHVRRRLEAVLDEGPGGWLPRIIFHCVHEHGHEQAMQLLRRHLEPSMRRFEDAVKRLLGSNATELHVRSCVFSLHSQCIHLNKARARGDGPLSRRELSPDNHEAVIRNLLAFMVGGVRHMRELIDAGAL